MTLRKNAAIEGTTATAACSSTTTTGTMAASSSMDSEAAMLDANNALLSSNAPSAAAGSHNHYPNQQSTQGGGGGSQEDEGEEEEDQAWRRSPFAVGPAKLTWVEDDRGCCGRNSRGHPSPLSQFTQPSSSGGRPRMYFTAFICSRVGAGRVGNMVVLWQTNSKSIDNNNQSSTTGEQPASSPPRLHLVVGPYWTVTLCVTLPLILLVSIWSLFKMLDDSEEEINTELFIPWCISTGCLLLSLFKVSCTNPGILHRHTTPPNINGNNSDNNLDTDEWIWNDQAYTFRPKHARFDPEIQAIISHYDHTCPWTGTAIGGNNMFWFRSFLFFLLSTLLLDFALLTFASGTGI